MPISPGDQIGRYKIRSLLGAGGMGEVYLAHDVQLDRPVAVKLLAHDVTTNADRLRRFKQEARATSALNHPNILTIYEIGETGGAHFIATEFIDGVTLRVHMARNSLKITDALDLAIQMTGALTAAHAAGIVHRDIKPENAMLRADGFLKLLDFGLAKLAERSSVDSEAITLAETDPGVVMGTVGYMSPEQARGLPVDARTDIFSMGVVLYEMLTGRSPFAGNSTSSVLVSILEREPPPLSRFMQNAPSELQRIITRSLAKLRDERYQTIRDLYVDLKNFKQEYDFNLKLQRSTEWRGDELAQEGEPQGGATVVGKPAYTIREQESDLYKNLNPTQPRMSQTASRRLNRDEPIDSLAVLPLVNASKDPNAEYLSDGITESIINSLSQLPQLRVMARSTVFRYKGMEVDPLEVGNALDVRAVMLGRVLQLGDQLVIKTELVDVVDGAHLWGAQYNRKPADILAVQDEISGEIVQKLRLRLTGEDHKKRLVKRYTDNTEAYQLYLKGRFYIGKATREGLYRGIGYFNEAISIDPTYALAYSGLAEAYYGLSSAHLPPKEAMPKARAAALKALEMDDTLAEAHASLALVKVFYDWDWAGAETEYRRAIELNPGYASAHHWYGWYLALMGRLDQATAEMKKAQELDPLSLEITADLGLSFFFAREYDLAIEQFRKALEMDQNFIWAHFFTGWAFEQQGLIDEAIAEYERAGQVGDAMVIKAALGHAYAMGGRRDEAQAILAESGEAAEGKHLSPYDCAIIHTALDEKQEAFACLEQAYENRSEALVWLKVDPRLDPLRATPQFIGLLRRVGLPL
ncbi:MAG TPA: protein kinase [Pyrinomonadaceae bacterium]|jgi:serine/threonine-protein kinase